MPALLQSTLFIVLGIAAMLWAAEALSRNAEKIAIRFGIPEFIIGVTLVALGTSLPELISSVFAVSSGRPEIVITNVVGSNVTNILLVLGVAAIVAKKLTVSFNILHVDLPIFITATFLFCLSVLDGKVSRFEGFIMVAALIVYILYVVGYRKEHDGSEITKFRTRKKITKWSYIEFALGGVALFFGARLAISSIINVSEMLNINPETVSITAFALGTSLPELFVSVSAAKKGLGDIVVGNVIGSSIFNLFGGIGIPAVWKAIPVSENLLLFLVPITVVTALVYIFTTQEKQITKWEGWILLLFYCFFIGQVVGFFNVLR
ncbi:calcium/sodium antiporter [Candidatus Nomurabacteria bacterium]|nr:calcium/sodium antiporter [Candidatus Nomurabacteria bacterium]